MAIARGAGTEIIRSVLAEDISHTGTSLIIGVQHHIYTVLSIIVQVQSIATSGNFVQCGIMGYDSVAGTTGREIFLFKQDLNQQQTYVWNDKFSFNGCEPTNFTGPMDSVAKQDAIADQAQATAQHLKVWSEVSGDNFDVICTYIDQNNA